MNVALGAIVLLVIRYQLLPQSNPNRRVPMAGSRFNPLPGERVVTGPTESLAIVDDPRASLSGREREGLVGVG
jgi:hypothetical protein